MRVLTFILCVLALAPVSANESRTKQDLTAVQEELKKSQQSYQQQSKRIAKLRKRLQSFEREVAQHAKALSHTELGINENRQQQYTLEQEAERLKKQEKRLQKILAGQLKSAYMTGSHDYSRMLLNQEASGTLERTISYYNYFNKARISQIEALKKVNADLLLNQASLARKRTELQALFNQQKNRLAELKKSQTQRTNSLSHLNKALKETESAIDYLKENEQTLIATLAALEEVQTPEPEQIQLNGLAKRKGRLAWPSKGRLKHRFGQRKHAGMNWKGVLINAQQGSTVKSVEQGQVVFADWLNGFGWVIVLDHGKGFMSLYGHAQTLLKDVGDLVTGGESIALVGQSGGQDKPGLYFEIRHKGSAVDPVKWCK